MARKIKIVSTRITQDELNFLIKKSSLLQLSVSNYIRLLIQLKKDTDEKIVVFNQSN
jgi:hypothetical protein